MKFIKRLLCHHYWDDGEPVYKNDRLGLLKHKCLKCDKTVVKKWPWAIRKNTSHQIY